MQEGIIVVAALQYHKVGAAAAVRAISNLISCESIATAVARDALACVFDGYIAMYLTM